MTGNDSSWNYVDENTKERSDCMHFYMAVTPDEYELPLAVRDTAREIAEIYGKKTTTVLKAVSDDRSGKQSGVKFIKVDGIEEEEW